MSVEEVHVPTSKHKIDPKKVGEKGEKDADYWKDKRDTSRAQREYLEEQQTMTNLGKKEKEVVKPAFGFKGEVNLGTIDLQAEREEAKRKLEEMTKEQEAAIKETGQENQQLRDRIHEQQLEMLQISFKAQMDIVTKAIEANASKGNLTEQLAAARVIAEDIGYQKGIPGGGSEMIQVELKRLDFEHTIALRKMVREDKAEERKWQLELRRLDDERKGKEAELAQQQKRDEMFAKGPEMLGRAIASGLAGGERATGQPAAKEQGGYIEANWGDSGEAECTECHGKIAIGPTARAAVCAGCGLKVPIHRVGEKPTKPAEAPAEAAEEPGEEE